MSALLTIAMVYAKKGKEVCGEGGGVGQNKKRERKKTDTKGRERDQPLQQHEARPNKSHMHIMGLCRVSILTY